MAKKSTKRSPGDVVAIPLPSGGYGYGLFLRKLFATYNLRTNAITAFADVVRKAILFTTAVNMRAVSGSKWPLVGSGPLDPKFNEPTKFFRPNPSGTGLLIYVSKPHPDHAYEEYTATVEECRNLEPLLVWDPEQIEQRLDDELSGQENIHLKYNLRS